MRPRFLLIALLVLLLALPLAACTPAAPEQEAGAAPTATVAEQGEPADEPTPTTTEGEKPAAKPTATVAAEEEPTEEPTVAEEGDAPDEIASVEDLDSYHSIQTIGWDLTGGETDESYEMTIEVWVTRDPPAQRIKMGGTNEDGEPLAIEMIQIGNAAYMDFGTGEWMATTSDEASMTDMGYLTDPADYVTEDAENLGVETVNGRSARHYRTTDSWEMALGMADLEEGQADWWVDEEEDLLVKMEITWTGTDDDGNHGTFFMTSDLLEVNEPIEITAPEGVAAPGLPEDIPMMDGATDFAAFGTMATFTVEGAVDDVVAYYESALADNGWTYAEDRSFAPTMLTFTKGSRSATVMVSDNEDGTVGVTIMTEEGE